MNKWQKMLIVFGIFAVAASAGGCASRMGGSSPGTEQPSGGFRDATEKVDASNPENIEQARVDMLRDYQNRVREMSATTFDDFVASTYREPGGGKYIVDGDTPITDIKHLEEFFESRIKKLHIPNRSMGELIVHAPGGVDAVWKDTEKRNLSYCVSRDFGSRYNQVVAAMADAAGAWEAVADIDFVHDATHDSNCTAANHQVVFDVRAVTGARYLARAFFPDNARSSRNVLINDSSFRLDPNGSLSLVGILRHELGHTLGFRHEHTRPEAGTCFEDNNFRPLTSYDAFSTMHYPQCNGAGDWSLELTAIDKSGAACLYGAAPGFQIDPNICTPPAQPTPPPGTCGPQIVEESGSVGRREVVQVGNYDVAPGTEFKVNMVGTGDPDLYVRFDNPPSTTAYDCRPYDTGATESCELTVPVGVSRGFVMVRGFSAGTYRINIEHTPNP